MTGSSWIPEHTRDSNLAATRPLSLRVEPGIHAALAKLASAMGEEWTVREAARYVIDVGIAALRNEGMDI